MQRVNLHARPSIMQVGCPTCCYHVCALDHVKRGTADLDHPSELCYRNGIIPTNEVCMDNLKLCDKTIFDEIWQVGGIHGVA